MKRLSAWFQMALGFLWMVSCNSQQDGVIQKINKATVEQEVIGKDVQWIDVRTPKEYALGHIDDALNFNVNGASFSKQIEVLDKSKPVYLYCKMGGRSTRAAQLLKKEGFSEIYNYTGGYDEWKSSK